MLAIAQVYYEMGEEHAFKCTPSWMYVISNHWTTRDYWFKNWIVMPC